MNTERATRTGIVVATRAVVQVEKLSNAAHLASKATPLTTKVANVAHDTEEATVFIDCTVVASDEVTTTNILSEQAEEQREGTARIAKFSLFSLVIFLFFCVVVALW